MYHKLTNASILGLNEEKALPYGVRTTLATAHGVANFDYNWFSVQKRYIFFKRFFGFQLFVNISNVETLCKFMKLCETFMKLSVENFIEISRYF